MLETIKRNFITGLVGLPALMLGVAVSNAIIKGAETAVKSFKNNK